MVQYRARTHNPKVPGSSPGTAIFLKDSRQITLPGDLAAVFFVFELEGEVVVDEFDTCPQSKRGFRNCTAQAVARRFLVGN